jgi:hypothetical protein
MFCGSGKMMLVKFVFAGGVWVVLLGVSVLNLHKISIIEQ